ncbi:MAG: hypothetical protein J7M25_13340 [Deltaproteobacteria bacterium]|nr:hypothetical protein [Deltaproteobacteria bacterium]
MFREHLQEMVEKVEGSKAALLMGFDGISIDAYTRPDLDEPFDIQTVGMELSIVMTQMSKAAELLEEGQVQEVAIRADRLTLVFRILSQEYFVLLALAPNGNFGKARFVLRMQVPKILKQLE